MYIDKFKIIHFNIIQVFTVEGLNKFMFYVFLCRLLGILCYLTALYQVCIFIASSNIRQNNN
jgi:hypothetical protein